MALVFQVDASDPGSYPGSGTTWYDISGSGNHVTLFNSPTFTNVGGVKSINFDGSTQYGSLSPAGLVYGTAPRSMSIWVRYNTWPGGGVGVAFMYGTSATGQDFGLWISPSAYYAASYADDLTFNASPALGRFYYLTNVYDGTTAKLYVNGVLVASATKSWNTVSGVANIGRYHTGAYYAPCSIGKASLWDTALTDGQVASFYAAEADTWPTVVSNFGFIDTLPYAVPYGMPSPEYLALARLVGGWPDPTPVVPNHAGVPSIL